MARMPLTSLPTLTWAEVGDWLLGAPLTIIVTVLVAIVASWLVGRLIRRVVDSATSRHSERLASLPGGRTLAVGATSERHVQRTRTMGALLRSIANFVIF